MRSLCLGLLCVSISISAVAAPAPDSIAGKIYRETTQIVTVRTSGEKTIVFQPDRRFVYLKTGFGGALILPAPFKIFLGAPHPDGTYTYQRTGESTGVVTLNNDAGPAETLRLTFTTATGGGFGEAIPTPSNSSGSFALSDLAEAQVAPAQNISVRGRVEDGHPLIIGFVVPGAPRPAGGTFVPPDGFRQREVLIRVVGPSLAPFGVTGTWADPDFQVFKGSNRLDPNEVHYADWSARPYISMTPEINADTQAAFRKIFSYAGAFPLLTDSKDAADVLRLDPGDYTIVCTAASGEAGGEALVEVYFLP